MRKILSLIIVMALSLGLYSQSQNFQILGAKKVDKFRKVDKYVPTGSPAVNVVRPLNNSLKELTISKVLVGQSINVWGLLYSHQTCLTINTDLNLIAFTARTNSSVYLGNHIGTYFSKDGGDTFNDSLLEPWQIPVAGYNARYPSGAIYNPSGNSDPDAAYTVVAGPMITPSTGTWGGAYLASQKFDGSGLDQQYTLYTTDTAGGVGLKNDMPYQFLQNRNGKIYVMGNSNEDDGTYYTRFIASLNIGDWDEVNNKVNWTRVNIDPEFPNTPDSLPAGRGIFGLAMSSTNSEGYAIFTGQNADATMPGVLQPVIFKTTDEGQTWAKQTFNWEDMESSALNDYIAEASVCGTPFFSEVKDAIVDKDGYLHFASIVWGAYSTNPDSLWYITDVNLWKAWVFDFHQTATGWDAVVIDTIFAEEAVDYPFTDIDSDERFQMSMTDDGSKIIYAWLDTDPSLDPDNKFSDIYVKLYDLNNGQMTEKINVTKNTELDATCFWMFLSDYSFSEGNGLYTIPITVSEHQAADTDPATHYYIKGVQIQLTDVNTIELANSTVTVYPNPATDIVNVDITSRNRDNFTINVYNAVSSLVMSKSIAVNGNATQTLDVTTLPSGIYMIEVTGNNGTTVRKMIKK